MTYHDLARLPHPEGHIIPQRAMLDIFSVATTAPMFVWIRLAWLGDSTDKTEVTIVG